MLAATPGTSTSRFASQTYVTREWTSTPGNFSKKETKKAWRREARFFTIHDTRDTTVTV